jgi:outer membrane lipoprotein-sorting protein
MIKVWMLTLSGWMIWMAPQQKLTLQEENVFKKGMQQRMSTLETLSSEFEQIRHLDFMDQPIRNKGTFHYKKPHHIRWNIGSTDQNSLILDDKFAYQIQEGKSRKMALQSNRGFKPLQQLLQRNTLDNNLFNEEAFSFSFFKQGQKVRIEMVPKDKNLSALFEKIEVIVDAKTYLIQELKLLEKAKNVTLITFQHQQINGSLPSSTFQIKP